MWMINMIKDDSEYSDVHHYMFSNAEDALEFAHSANTDPDFYISLGAPYSLELMEINPSEHCYCDGEWDDGDQLYAVWHCDPVKALITR